MLVGWGGDKLPSKCINTEIRTGLSTSPGAISGGLGLQLERWEVSPSLRI
jgi:hypothetical protein